jgi:rare lipoprotein A
MKQQLLTHISVPRVCALTALVLLCACSKGGPVPKGVKIGKPYSISGKSYYPEYDPTYDETGIASWYGPGFHGNSTANGERFDTHDLTAAHPTLPMPSLVRVTNLQNGKTMVVRINDRGPFSPGRIIDLSKASAQKLGITGLAKVRVQYLVKESDQYIAAVAEGRRIDMAAYNEQLESDKHATILAATAPSGQSFIIESSQNQTQPSDTVVNAAPIISVSNADLPAKGEKKKSSGMIIREAWAGSEEGASAPSAGTMGKEVVLIASNTSTPPAPRISAKENTAKSNAAGYFIQIGSFGQQANAEKMKNHVDTVAPASIAMVEVSGHQWWRLRSGPFDNKDEADHALEKIRASGAPDARIVKQ